MKNRRSLINMLAVGGALFLAAALLSGCAPERKVIARNLGDATATVLPTAIPTEGFVLLHTLFGTPTPSGASEGSPVQPTPVQVAAAPTLPPTRTPIPTATTAAAATAPAGSGGSGGGGEAPAGNARNGDQIFHGVGTCTTCHDIDNGIQMTGPTLKGIGKRAETRVQGLPAAAYLRQSIVQPNVYVVQGFVQGIMPQNFAQMLSAQQINDLIAYLLTK